jgi:4-amino-4-deoxy-L-arabinose transferase-like glycosyltransferase
LFSNTRIRFLSAAFFAAIVVGIGFFAHLGVLGLLGPDEPRYAFIARAMAQTGDWITPRLYGQPWFEKPVLYYWAAGLFFRLLGPHGGNEWPARLPSAIAALAATLAMAWAARKHYGDRTAWLVLLLLPTCVAGIGFSHSATPDMLFSAALALALSSAAGVLRRKGALRTLPADTATAHLSFDFGVVLFGVWLGVATLAKGPAAVILAGGSIGLWALATRKWRAAFALAHPLGIAAFFCVALPWYVVCAVRNPDFLRTFLFLHNVQRFLTPVFEHRQPFWFFIPILLLGLFPWTALLLPALADSLRLWRKGSWQNSPGFFFACWAIFPVFFFSASQSKLPGYVLPAIPPLVLLLARAFARRMCPGQQSSRWPLAVVGLSWCLLSLLSPVWLRRLPAETHSQFATQIHADIAVLLLASLAIIALSLLRRPVAALAVSALLTLSLLEYASLRLLPRLDPYLSAREYAPSWLALSADAPRMRTFHLQRSWQYGLNFYYGRELPELSTPAERGVIVYTTPVQLNALAQSPFAPRTSRLANDGVLVLAYLP